MKLSQCRKDAIYSVVHDRFVALRIALAKHPKLQGTKLGREVDDLVYAAQFEASDAAARAAGGES